MKWQERTCHGEHALVLFPRFEVVAFPAFEALGRLDCLLCLFARVVQRLDATLRDHCRSGERSARRTAGEEVDYRSFERTRFDGALQNVVQASHDVHLLGHAGSNELGVGCIGRCPSHGVSAEAASDGGKSMGLEARVRLTEELVRLAAGGQLVNFPDLAIVPTASASPGEGI